MWNLSFFSVLIIGTCRSTNSFVSVSLPLCTQPKWAPITVICFRKALSIHRIEFKLEVSQPKSVIKIQEPKGLTEENCSQMNELWPSWVFTKSWAMAKMFDTHELRTAEIINKNLQVHFLPIFLLHHLECVGV